MILVQAVDVKRSLPGKRPESSDKGLLAGRGNASPKNKLRAARANSSTASPKDALIALIRGDPVPPSHLQLVGLFKGFEQLRYAFYTLTQTRAIKTLPNIRDYDRIYLTTINLYTKIATFSHYRKFANFDIRIFFHNINYFFPVQSHS